MADVKWIKLSTNMFDDEKIKLIEQMPEADTILVIWVKLLAQAGKTNASGYIYLNENIPFTDEMIATIFYRPLPVVRLALQTLQQFGMIDITDDKFISVTNWDKHQNVQGLDKIREQTRERVRRHRERKMLLEQKRNVTRNDDVTDKELDLELELELEEEKKEKVPYVEIVNYLNHVTSSNYRHTTKKTQELIRARWNEGFKLEEFKTVIDKKAKEWINDDKMSTYLRPTTLFGTNFEGYLNQIGGNKNGSAPTIGNTQRPGPSKTYEDGINF